MTEQEVLAQVAHLPPEERAAAIAHLVFCQAADEFGWPLKVPRDWAQLDTRTRNFNVAQARKWATSPHALAAWVKALEQGFGGPPSHRP